MRRISRFLYVVPSFDDCPFDRRRQFHTRRDIVDMFLKMFWNVVSVFASAIFEMLNSTNTINLLITPDSNGTGGFVLMFMILGVKQRFGFCDGSIEC